MLRFLTCLRSIVSSSARDIASLGVCELGTTVRRLSRVAFIHPFNVLGDMPSSRAALLRPHTVHKVLIDVVYQVSDHILAQLRTFRLGEYA